MVKVDESVRLLDCDEDIEYNDKIRGIGKDELDDSCSEGADSMKRVGNSMRNREGMKNNVDCGGGGGGGSIRHCSPRSSKQSSQKNSVRKVGTNNSMKNGVRRISTLLGFDDVVVTTPRLTRTTSKRVNPSSLPNTRKNSLQNAAVLAFSTNLDKKKMSIQLSDSNENNTGNLLPTKQLSLTTLPKSFSVSAKMMQIPEMQSKDCDSDRESSKNSTKSICRDTIQVDIGVNDLRGEEKYTPRLSISKLNSTYIIPTNASIVSNLSIQTALNEEVNESEPLLPKRSSLQTLINNDFSNNADERYRRDKSNEILNGFSNQHQLLPNKSFPSVFSESENVVRLDGIIPNIDVLLHIKRLLVDAKETVRTLELVEKSLTANLLKRTSTEGRGGVFSSDDRDLSASESKD